MRRCLPPLLLMAALAGAAERQAVYPPNVKPVGPYTPGILAGDYLYVSGQGAQRADGTIVTGIDRQTRQTLDNVKAVVEAAGLTMEHIVYTQVYLKDISRYFEMNEVYRSYFPRNPPARAVVGVARMPLDTPVEIAAVAVRDILHKKILRVPGVGGQTASPVVFAPHRVYISGVLGRYADTNRLPDEAVEQVKLALDNFKLLLKRAGRRLDEVAVATVYVNDNIPVEIVEELVRKELPSFVLVRVDALPLRSNIEITGIVAPDLELVNAAGPTEEVLKGFGTLRDAVVSNVYIDAIENFGSMNKIYASFFPGMAPTRTTVQALAEGAATGNQITILKLKPRITVPATPQP